MKSPLDDAILAARSIDIDRAGARSTKCRSISSAAGSRCCWSTTANAGSIVKGAPEDILRLSDRHETADGQVLPLDEAATRAPSRRRLTLLAAEGYRALGIATPAVEPDHATASVADEAGLVFAGFAVFLDPPKASAGATIKALRTDGVTVKLLTGDNEQVARHVLRRDRRRR